MQARRTTRIRLAAGAAALALGVTGAGVAMAAQGPSGHPEDSPRVHVRSHDRHESQRAEDRLGPRHERAERRHGADDPAGDDRGAASDDPAGHVRHGGDDASGDDHGGCNGRDDGGRHDRGSDG